MRAAALQFDVRAGEVARNLARVEAGLRSAAQRGVELVVLPEMWPTSLQGPGQEAAARAATPAAVERLRALTAELGLCVLGSAYAPAPAEERAANRLHAFDAGRELFAYDKVHLFSPTAEDQSFAAGEDPPPTVEARGARISGMVCYDLRFPELARVPFRAGAQVLCIAAQWPRPRDAHWRALAIARAIENQCFVVACNRTGRSLVGRRRLELEFPGNSLLVAPQGEVLAEGRGEEGLVEAELELELARRYRTRLPVAKDERPELYRRWLP